MQDFTNWVLTSILGPLMLPLFALMTLCLIADLKPEPIVTAFISLITGTIGGAFRLLTSIITGILRLGQHSSYPPPRRKYPPRS